MTIDKLLSFVRLMSNKSYVRWWAHFNYPQRSPHLMAIAAIDHNGNPMIFGDLQYEGFERDVDGHLVIWTIARTNEDGTPFVSNL